MQNPPIPVHCNIAERYRFPVRHHSMTQHEMWTTVEDSSLTSPTTLTTCVTLNEDSTSCVIQDGTQTEDGVKGTLSETSHAVRDDSKDIYTRLSGLAQLKNDQVVDSLSNNCKLKKV